MKEPTEAQIKEFWEWCGFTFIMNYDDPTIIEESRSPIGERIFPPTDLSNLFEYAVPKMMAQHYLNGYKLLIKWIGDWSDKWNTQDPALTLFWAIKESL